jgi:undecaprenyl diphosphate synthase
MQEANVNESFEHKRMRTAERLGIPPQSVPRHVAIIMDGNGRWARQRDLPRFHGHEQGGKTVEKIALYGVKLGIECMSLYSFSLQNWKRPKEEVDFLMHLYSLYLEAIRPDLMTHNVRLVHLGRLDRLPQKVVDTLHKTVEITGTNTGMVLAIALNYGGRAEIVDAVKRIAADAVAGKLSPADIEEATLDRNLYTAGLPDPDLLIRTSGEMRISNFLLWQISYAEFFVTHTLWPDFSEADFDEAIRVFSGRSRRFGDVKSQTV